MEVNKWGQCFRGGDNYNEFFLPQIPFLDEQKVDNDVIAIPIFLQLYKRIRIKASIRQISKWPSYKTGLLLITMENFIKTQRMS